MQQYSSIDIISSAENRLSYGGSMMENFKQFSLEERIIIQNELNSRKSFKAIAKQLAKPRLQ